VPLARTRSALFLIIESGASKAMQFGIALRPFDATAP